MATVKSKDEPRIDVSQAARAAADYFRKLFPLSYSFTLEEVELSEDGKFWLITLGFEKRRDRSKGMDDLLNPPKTKFKLFKVDAQTGDVVAMKIREVEWQ